MKKKVKKIFQLLVVVTIVTGFWHVLKPLPDGVSVAGKTYFSGAEDVEFLSDLTYVDAEGNRQSEQEIFDAVYKMIDDAENYILIDMFLYNDFIGSETTSYRSLSGDLTQKLISKKQISPEMSITVITDPLNVVYGGDTSENLESLQAAGIDVVFTDLTALRDSNPVYSMFWRTFGQWWGNSTEGGVLPHIMEQRRGKLTLRTYLRMINFKANHRKIVVTDKREDDKLVYETLVTSANPHDGSSAHTNVALKVRGPIARDAILSESAVGEFSGVNVDLPETLPETLPEREAVGPVELTYLTEGAIKDALIEDIGNTDKGGRIDMLMFYIADRDIIKVLMDAADREAELRLVFDPNKDAFGREKNGIPNRQVAYDLMQHAEKNPEANIEIRWCNTHGEQCHSKLTLIERGEDFTMHIGSANLTRRNIGDYNLETNIRLKAREDITATTGAKDFFQKQWENRDGIEYTLPYEKYKDTSKLRYNIYRFMESTGMSSF